MSASHCKSPYRSFARQTHRPCGDRAVETVRGLRSGFVVCGIIPTALALVAAGCGEKPGGSPLGPNAMGPAKSGVGIGLKEVASSVDRTAGPSLVHLEKPAQDRYRAGDSISFRVLVTPPRDVPAMPWPVCIEVKRGKIVAGDFFLDRVAAESRSAGELTFEGNWEIPRTVRPGAYSLQARVVRPARDRDQRTGREEKTTGSRADLSETRRVVIDEANTDR